jgi:putative acetyltransferase
VIRDYRPGDETAVRAVVTAAFEGEGPNVAALVDGLRPRHARVELVAEEAGGVVGHVLLSHSWIDAREALVDVLVLSPLSVDPAHQGRGLGTDLVREAIGAANRLGAPAMFLEGSPAYYGPRGFEPAEELDFQRPSARIPGPAFQVVVLDAHEEWMTGPLVYCEPFWARDCVGLRDPELDRIERMFDQVT